MSEDKALRQKVYKIVTICMSPEMHQRARKLAKREQCSFSCLVRDLLALRIGYDDEYELHRKQGLAD